MGHYCTVVFLVVDEVPRRGEVEPRTRQLAVDVCSSQHRDSLARERRFGAVGWQRQAEVGQRCRCTEVPGTDFVVCQDG